MRARAHPDFVDAVSGLQPEVAESLARELEWFQHCAKTSRHQLQPTRGPDAFPSTQGAIPFSFLYHVFIQRGELVMEVLHYTEGAIRQEDWEIAQRRAQGL